MYYDMKTHGVRCYKCKAHTKNLYNTFLKLVQGHKTNMYTISCVDALLAI